MKEGKRVAQLQQAELESLSGKWMASMVLYVVGETPTIAAVNRYIADVWNHVAQPEVFLHDDGYFIVKLLTVEDRNDIIYGGPYLFYNKPLILKPWTSDFNFYEEVLKVIPLWVKLPNLPLNCWSSDSLSRIGSILGIPLCSDECTTKQMRISFARLLVEMDITSTLPDHIWIEDANGKPFKQVVLYDWKPAFCKNCNVAGHNCEQQVSTDFPIDHLIIEV